LAGVCGANGGFDMNGPARTLPSSELRTRWGWSDEDLLEAMRMGLPAYEPGTKRALSANDIIRLTKLVSSGRKMNVRYTSTEVEQFKRDHPEIFPRGLKPKPPKRQATESLRMSVKKVAERWTCSVDLIQLLVADGLLPPPEGAGPEGWFDRKAFHGGDDTSTSNLEMFSAERAWEAAAGWKPKAIHEFERNHPQFFEHEHLSSVPEVTRSSPPVTPVESSASLPRTSSKPQLPAQGCVKQADEPRPATASEPPKDAANGSRAITNEDLEAAVEVAVEMCRWWWGKQPEDGKRAITEVIAHVKKALAHRCDGMSDTRLTMIASKANLKPAAERRGRRN
jgi:hypothetical protein